MNPTKSKNIEYENKLPKWQIIHRFLTGENIEKELKQASFEQKSRYESRKNLSDFRPITRQIIMRLVGSLYSSEVEREDAGLIPDSFYRSAGINNEDYEVLLYKIAQTAISYNRVAIGVKPGPKLEVITPISVPRWKKDSIIVKSNRSLDRGIEKPEKVEDVWVVHKPFGFKVYAQDDDGKSVDTGLGRQYPIEFRINNKPQSPYFMSSKLWTAAFGYEVARSHRSIYRMRSSIDAGLVEAMNSSVIQAAVGGDEDFAMAFKDALKRNESYVPYEKELGEHKPLSLPTGPVESGMDLLEKKEDSINELIGHFGNAVQNNTATEATINAKSGIDALLTTLGAFMSSIEEDILRRVAIMNDVALNNSNELNEISVNYGNEFISQ